MNKRPHPGLGLPAKPYTPSQPGPAPPLPAGPPPQQQQQYTPEQQNAHAAAWAAYYQAQGQNAGAAYNAGSSAPAANPYANYGYGGGAMHQQNSQQQGYQQQGGYQGPSGPAGGAGGYGAPAPAPPQPYGGAPGYTPPAPRPAYNGGYSGQGSPQQPQQYGGGGYGGGSQNQPYYPQAQAQGYNPPPGPNQSPNQQYRPQPGGQQNRPYTPQPGPPRGGGGGGGGGNNNMPPRPPGPGGAGGAGGGFPPAKRPRFDGPGGGPPSGGVLPRPPANRTPQNNYGSGMARPMSGSGRGGAPMSHGHRSPTIPRIGFSNSSRGGGPMRGGGMGGRGGAMRGGGMMRGSARRDRDQRERDQRDRDRDRERMARRAGEPQTQRDRKRKDKNEKDARTTMTDFRIVGIEVKQLDWTWGLIGEHVVEEEKEKKEDDDEAKVENDLKAEPKEEAKTESEAKAEPEAKPETETKEESAADPVKAEPEEAADPEKRGEKRKAKPSSVDGDESQSPKKRSAFSVTHGKSNEPSAPTSSPESNQNRFRIYFESPPELDRVPKTARRNPNKRGRRESSSVAPSRIGETEVHEEEYHHEEGAEQHPEEIHEQAEEHEEGDAKEAAPEAEQPAEPEAAAEAPVPETEAAAAPAPSDDAKPTQEGETGAEAATEDVGDVSMVTAPGEDTGETAASGLTGAEASQAELESALAASAANAASAYARTTKQRTRRWSSCSADSQSESVAAGDVAHPSVNRVSVLYEDSSRRLVFDASVVSKIRIFRAEGRIEVDLFPASKEKKEKKEKEKKEEKGEEKEEKKEGDEKKEADSKEQEDNKTAELPKGVLVETYDSAEQRFVAVSREKLDQLWTAESDKTLPPLHRVFAASTPSAPITLTVFLNKKKPLSEPKWCRTNQADEWLYEQFGRRAGAEGGWRGKLEIMDPDAPPTLASILDSWKGGSSAASGGTSADRTEFTTSLLASPNDLLEILLRLTRGDRNPVASIGTGPSSALGPLATAIRPDSPYASHQTHVSLAILAMYRLTTDYAHAAGVKTAVLNDKIADIIKSLPTHMIHKSLDGLYKEWLAERKQ